LLFTTKLVVSLSMDTVSKEDSLNYGFGRLFGFSFSAFFVFLDEELAFGKRLLAAVLTLSKADGFSDKDT